MLNSKILYHSLQVLSCIIGLYILAVAALAFEIWISPLGYIFLALSSIFFALLSFYKVDPEPTLKEKLLTLARKALFIQ